MGYYTEHTLTARCIKNKDQFEQLCQELKRRDLIGYASETGLYAEKSREAIFYPYDSAKWYDHSVDMLHIAEKFPNMYFELEGSGEDFGDFWREYYHDMDIECCRGDVIFEQPKKIQWNQLIKF